MEYHAEYAKPAEAERDYLHFVIKDETKKVRGRIIGSSHSIDRADSGLNSGIKKAVETAHKIWMELPPGHALLAKKPAERVIEGAVRHIENIAAANPPSVKERVKSFESHANIERETQAVLADIRTKTTPGNFARVEQALRTIGSPASKLAFCKKIQESIEPLNQVNLETVLAKLPGAKEKMVPLEDIDLGQVLKEAEAKVKPEERALLDNIDPVEQKKVEAQIYEAWRKGDTKALKELMGKDGWSYLMPAAIRNVMQTRDINIAQRIANVVKDAGKDEEDVFVVGLGHLVNHTDNDVLNYLRNDHFKGDMSGWTVEQVPLPPASPEEFQK